MASAIRKDMRAAYAQASECPGLSSDLLPCLQEIFPLSRLPRPEALDLAIGVMTDFADMCCGKEDWWTEEGAEEREADRPPDILFCSLVRWRLRTIPARDEASSVLDDLLNMKKGLKAYGLEKGYSDRTIAALRKWQDLGPGGSGCTSD